MQAIGIDVGGTKIAAGLVELETGRVLERLQAATRPERGGAAVLGDCAAMAARLGGGRLPVGIALCELVDLAGRPASAETVDWLGLDVRSAVGASAVVVESDVRAAALGEARFGAGAGRSPAWPAPSAPRTSCATRHARASSTRPPAPSGRCSPRSRTRSTPR